MINFTFLYLLIFLLLASIQDIKTREISHKLILFFLFLDLIFFHNLISFFSGLFLFLISFSLFYIEMIGAGDVKVLLVLYPMFLYSSLLSIFAYQLMFIWTILGLGLIFRFYYKKEIPLVPIILLTFILFFLNKSF